MNRLLGICGVWPRITTVVAVLLLAAPFGAEAQAGKVPRIGVLTLASLAGNADYIEGFRAGLCQLGYVEGKSILIDYRFADGSAEQLPGLAAELLRLGTDVLVTPTTPSTIAAKQATKTVPIVLMGVGNPLETALIDSLAKPGGNITGVTSAYDEIAAKWLQLLLEAVPRASKVGFLGNLANPYQQTVVKHLWAAGQTLGVAIQIFSAMKSDEVEPQLKAIAKARLHAIVVGGDPVLRTKRKETVAFLARARVPAMYAGKDYVDEGGLMSYDPSRPEMGRQAAVYVDKILKGAKPADLPVEQATKFELIINLKTAKALGLTIPPSLLLRADQVVE